MQLQINITDESKAMFLIELLQSLDYVQIIDELTSPITEQEINAEFSNEQITELDQLIEEFESGKAKLYSWEEVKFNVLEKL
jgi:hypothetical protein